MSNSVKKLGELLVAEGRLTNLQLTIGLAAQADTHKRLGRILVEKGFTTEAHIAECLAAQYGYEIVDLGEVSPQPEAVAALPRELAESAQVVPLEISEEVIVCALADPMDTVTTEEIIRATGRGVQVKLAYETAVCDAIAKAYASVEPTPESAHTDLPARFTLARLRARNESDLWYSAFDSVLNREVTLLKTNSSRSFEQICWAAGCVSPFVSRVYESFEDSESRWTVLEPLHGEALESRISQRGRLPLEHATRVVADVAEGISKAEAPSGFVCPANVVVRDRALLVPFATSSGSFIGLDDLSALGLLLFVSTTGLLNADAVECMQTPEWDRLPKGLQEVLHSAFGTRGSQYGCVKSLVVALRSFTWNEEAVEQQTTKERNLLLEHLPGGVVQGAPWLWKWASQGRRTA